MVPNVMSSILSKFCMNNVTAQHLENQYYVPI